MADALRAHGRPLGTLETGTPLARMDVVGFSLQYEMTFTNVLEMLDLAGIPLRSRDRGESDPLVVAGGPVVFNCEPVADFVDLVFIGDAEETPPGVPRALKALKRSGAPRSERIRRLARDRGDLRPRAVRPRETTTGCSIPVGTGGAPYPVRRRIVYDLDRFPFPDRSSCPTARSCTTASRSRSCADARSGAASARPVTSTGPTRERDPEPGPRHRDPLGARHRLRRVLARPRSTPGSTARSIRCSST